MPHITFPGVTGVVSLDITTSVGISPASIAMVVYPDSTPAVEGDLVFGTELATAITMPDCLVEYQETVKEKDRAVIILRLFDRRHRWKYGFPQSGNYNQESMAKKLVSWTVRSPWQLAYKLLTDMGELVDAADQIDLPGGLANPDLPMGPLDLAIDPAGEYLTLGQNYAPTSTNPPTNWSATPSGNALADLAETYGRIVVLDTITNRVRLQQLGSGSAPPSGFRKSEGVSLNRDSIPANVIVRGAPDRVQMRLRVRSVCREWDNSWPTPERVSYAPARDGQTMRVEVGGTYNGAATYGVKINNITFTRAAGAGSMATIATDLSALVNANAGVAAKVTASAVGNKLRIDADAEGYEFELFTTGTGTATEAEWGAECLIGPVTGTRPQQNAWRAVYATAVVTNTLTAVVNGTTFTAVVGAAGGAAAVRALALDINTSAEPVKAAAGNLTLVVTGNVAGVALTLTAAGGGAVVTEVSPTSFTPKGFEKVAPPFAFMALPTDRLNKTEAQRLAAESVYKCYQVLCVNPADDTDGNIPIPNYGTTNNRYTLVLQSSRPEPIQPEPGNVNVGDPRTLGQPYAAETYNGYAVDRPNIAYGSICWFTIARLGLLWTKIKDLYFKVNTPPRLNGEPTRLPVTFNIVDPERQVIQFSEPVYRLLGRMDLGFILGLDGTAFLPADIVIECGVIVLDPDTYAPKCFEKSMAIPGGFGPDAVRVFPDVQREIIGIYDDRHVLTGFRVLDADAENRAAAYLEGWAKTFQNPVGSAIVYDRVVQIGLSGRIRQIHWTISAAGLSTSVGENCEVSRVIVPYPTRRRQENLPPNSTRSLQNFLGDARTMGLPNTVIQAVTAALRGTTQ